MLDGDGFVAADLSVRVQNSVPDHGGIHRVVADGMGLAGQRIEMRVGGEAPGEEAVKVAARAGLEQVGDFDRQAAGLDDGPDLSAHRDNVRVRTTETAGRAGDRRLAEGLADFSRADPAVAVPERLAAFEADAVQHAVAGEPVMGGGIGRCEGVRSVAQVEAVEGGGDGAGDLEVRQRVLILQRGVDAGEIGVWRLGLPVGAVEARNPHEAFGDNAADGGFDGAGH